MNLDSVKCLYCRKIMVRVWRLPVLIPEKADSHE